MASGVANPPTVMPRVFLNQGKTQSGDSQLLEVTLPGIAEIWTPTSWVLPVDLKGDGNVHLVFMVDAASTGPAPPNTQVFDLALTTAVSSEKSDRIRSGNFGHLPQAASGVKIAQGAKKRRARGRNVGRAKAT